LLLLLLLLVVVVVVAIRHVESINGMIAVHRLVELVVS